MKETSPSYIQTRSRTAVFRGKAILLQLNRGFKDLFENGLGVHKYSDELRHMAVVAESKTPLWTTHAPEERFLVAGKVQNLRIAVGKIDGLEIPAGQIFSFWKIVGKATRRSGFVAGRELREGCIIPSIGGGLCQLSNALYDAALKAGFEIIERHAHTKVIEGSLAEIGRDATVFWNYIDLRFRSGHAFRIEASLGKDHLSVRFKCASKIRTPVRIEKRNSRAESESAIASPNSCVSCGDEGCFRSLRVASRPEFGRTAFLLDEFSPEFDRYVRQVRGVGDTLFIPLDGKRFGKANYAWETGGFSGAKQSLSIAALRSYKSRKLSAQGAARQRNLLEMSAKLAQSYAKKLTHGDLHLVIQQNLLPFLWKSGALGGRSFDVVMTALPMFEIQNRLDQAHLLHPESGTLADFRADENLLKAESDALANAEKIITAHTAIAALFGERAVVLDWELPPTMEIKKRNDEKFTVVFPAATVGRKGCYELRDAIRGLDVRLVAPSVFIESKDFWSDFDFEPLTAGWLESADLVVLPAFIEHKPRRLLQAMAAGIPVIASNQCGIGQSDGIKTIEAGDAASLRRLIKLQVAAAAIDR